MFTEGNKQAVFEVPGCVVGAGTTHGCGDPVVHLQQLYAVIKMSSLWLMPTRVSNKPTYTRRCVQHLHIAWPTEQVLLMSQPQS